MYPWDGNKVSSKILRYIDLTFFLQNHQFWQAYSSGDETQLSAYELKDTVGDGCKADITKRDFLLFITVKYFGQIGYCFRTEYIKTAH